MYNREFGAMHIRTALILVAISVAAAVAIFFGYLHLSYFVAALPAIYAWARPSAYRLIADAMYHAHHRFELDMKEEEIITQNFRMDQAVSLDAERMLREMAADDERSGRC